MKNTEVTKKQPKTEIFEYIRRRKNGKVVKVGVIFGLIDGKKAKIGWSKCNLKAGDKFDTTIGLQYAINRAMKPDATPTPNCIRRQVRQFAARCVRYFKDAQTVELPI